MYKLQKNYLLLAVVFLTMTVLTGCGSSDINLDDKGPEWNEQLASRIEASTEGKIIVPSSKSKKRRRRHRQSARDEVVVPQTQTRPRWVNNLNQQIDDTHKVGKGLDGTGKKYKNMRRRVPTADIVNPPVARRTPTPPFVKPLQKRLDPPRVKGGKNKYRMRMTTIGSDLVGGRSHSSASGGGPQVDILFNVDASHSMYDFLVNAQSTFRGFVQALSALDWRIYFMSPDPGYLFSSGFYNKGGLIPLEDNGRLLTHAPRFLSPQVRNHSSIFLDTLRHHSAYEYASDHSTSYISTCTLSPGCSNWHEQPLKNLQYALQANKGTFRPNARKVVIVISDSDEGKNGGKYVKAEDIVQTFKNQLTGTLTAYGVLVRPGDYSCQADYGDWWDFSDEDKYGVQLARLAELTGGVNFSLCSTSYVPLAQKIVADSL